MKILVPGRPVVDDRVEAYLRVLGVGAVPPPDLSALQALHAAHVERVPWTTLDLVLGNDTPVDETSSRRRILRGRGGHGFHLNAAFAWLLEHLGFVVRRHAAGIQGPDDPGPVGADGSHLGLSVVLGPQGTWLVDVGLGDGLHSPVPLRHREVVDGAFRLRVLPSEAVPGGWRLEPDRWAGSFVALDVAPEDVTLAEATRRHAELSRPGSRLTRAFVLRRRDADGIDVLEGCRLRSTGLGRQSLRVLAGPDELRGVMQEVFNLDVDRLQLSDDQLRQLLSADG